MRNDVYKQDVSPVSVTYPGDRATADQLAGHDAAFPYIFTTYRLTEHHTGRGDEPHAVQARRIAAGVVL